MAYLKRGARVSCRISAYNIVSGDEENFDDLRTFEIISRDNNGYYLFIPQYILIKNSIKIATYDLRELDILPRFLGEEMIYIVDGQIFKIESSMSGMICSNCLDFYEYAIPNQTDDTLICFACRQNPHYK